MGSRFNRRQYGHFISVIIGISNVIRRERERERERGRERESVRERENPVS